ncbi:hypothetical protein PTI98_010520 [Pleurotus ostreatus]|nr:hypothetical protein PTI98_010520 [Pleurotus ostreatus]
MRYLKFYNHRFMHLQSSVFGSLVGSSMGLLTALFTVVSVQPMQSSLPDSFMKTVVFQTIWSCMLPVLSSVDLL